MFHSRHAFRSGSLVKQAAVLVRHLAALRVSHLAAMIQVSLVAKEKDWDIGWAFFLFDICDEVWKGGKSIPVTNAVYDEKGVSAAHLTLQRQTFVLL